MSRYAPLCRNCARRPAKSKLRGRWVVLKHHDLCRQCYESLLASFEASQLRRALAAELAAKSRRWSRPF
jgi:hypothetical protein